MISMQIPFINPCVNLITNKIIILFFFIVDSKINILHKLKKQIKGSLCLSCNNVHLFIEQTWSKLSVVRHHSNQQFVIIFLLFIAFSCLVSHQREFRIRVERMDQDRDEQRYLNAIISKELG